MTAPGSLVNNPDFRALKAQVDLLTRRMQSTRTMAANSLASSAKRFRIGVFTVPLTLLGGAVSGSVRWSTPITDAAGNVVDAYNVDAHCSAMPNTQWGFTTSAMSSAGVTIGFTAPVLLAAGSVVVVLGVAPSTA